MVSSTRLTNILRSFVSEMIKFMGQCCRLPYLSYRLFLSSKCQLSTLKCWYCHCADSGRGVGASAEAGFTSGAAQEEREADSDDDWAQNDVFGERVDDMPSPSPPGVLQQGQEVSSNFQIVLSIRGLNPDMGFLAILYPQTSVQRLSGDFVVVYFMQYQDFICCESGLCDMETLGWHPSLVSCESHSLSVSPPVLHRIIFPLLFIFRSGDSSLFWP